MSRASDVTVGEVLLRIETGKSLKTQERPAAHGELGILRVSAVTWGEFRPNENKAVLPGHDPQDCPRPSEGDILISRANTRELVGAPVIVAEDHPHLLLSDKILRLVPDETRVNRRYLARALRSRSARLHFEQRAGGTSGSMTNITQEDIRATPLPLPPLPEQRRIADILDKADAIRRKRKQAIALTEQLLRSTFLEMFGDPVTNPKGWPTVPLTQIAGVTTGNTPSRAIPENFGNHIEWIKSDNINTRSHYLTRASEWLSKKGKEQGRTAPAGSTLMTCIAGSPDCIGNVALTDREVAFNQQINAMTPHDGIDPRFLYTLFLLGKRLVQSASTNSMKGMVSKGRLEEVRFPVPPGSEGASLQKAFGAAFSRTVRIGERQERAYEHADHLFSTLVHRAFSGTLTT